MYYLDKIFEDFLNKGYSIVKIAFNFHNSISDVFSQGEGFFALNIEEKMKFSSPELLEGFRAYGIEYSQSADQPDLNESFSVWKRNLRSNLVSKWSGEIALHNSMSALFEPFTKLANSIFKTLQAQINKTGQMIEESDLDYLQMNYYEPIKHDRHFLQDAHEDGHLLTITTATQPGLEVLVKGEFQPIVLNENELLVMPGSILTLITGGIIKPLYHRVRNNRVNKVRESLMFFVNLSLDREQKPWIANETNRDVDIRAKAIENSSIFGLARYDSIPKIPKTVKHISKEL